MFWLVWFKFQLDLLIGIYIQVTFYILGVDPLKFSFLPNKINIYV